MSDKTSSANWYVVLRAAEIFNIKNGRYPGLSNENIKSDCEELNKIAQDLLKKWNLDPNTIDYSTYVAEL